MNLIPKHQRKRLNQLIAFNAFRLISFSVVAILFVILGFIMIRGAGVISWDFITKMPDNGMTEGGILLAIVGSMILVVGSMMFAFPIGVLSGIYLNEYLKESWFKKFIRLIFQVIDRSDRKRHIREILIQVNCH